MIELIWNIVEVNVFAEESYGMKKCQQNKILQRAFFMHRMYSRYFVRNIRRPHAVLNSLPIDIGKHSQRNVYYSVCF